MAGGLASAPTGAEEASGRVLVVRPDGGIYAQIAEEFEADCRVRAQTKLLKEDNAADIRRAVRSTDVVLAVGQRAVDALRGVPATVVAALVFSPPPGVIQVDPGPGPSYELTLEALQRALPDVTRVGLVYGRETEEHVQRFIVPPARRLKIELVKERVSDGPDAVRTLRRMAPYVEALLLVPDLEVMTPQVFQYALGLQIQRALPILGVTRHQVKSGAFLAYDADPRALGRQAAEVVHQLLDGVSKVELLDSPQAVPVELTVKGDVARRLKANLAPLRNLQARFE
ncbi:MAG TPA: ABC transporter substrate binding protein [Polyangia bacterium]|jgi:hypothetical protein|nr:ABC transporter substrate binding protein [Polyangia bacterium]